MDKPKIIYEDKNFLGVYKPAGMVVHPYRASGGSMMPEKTLVSWLEERYPEIKGVGDDPEVRPGIVHRLDRETSGVMVVARNQRYFEYLKSLFKTGQVKKTYLAVVFGEPNPPAGGKKGTIDKPIGIRNGSIKRSIHSEKMKKNAITEYEIKKTFVAEEIPFSLLEVHPLTGRTHQIRVHLASIGHPVVGDKLYGGKNQPQWAKRLMLHACSLEFPLADGGRLKLEAEPEDSFDSLVT